MTLGTMLIFLTCIGTGMGLSFHSGIAMKAEERFFAGWVLGVVAVTISGIVSTRLFSFNGWAVTLACGAALAAAAPGWLRGIDGFGAAVADLRRRLTTPLRSGENPMLLVALLVPLWVVIARMFYFAYQPGENGAIMVGHLASFSDWQAHLTYTASFAYADNTALNLPLAAGYDIGYHGGVNYFAALLTTTGTSLPASLQVSGAFVLFAFPGLMYTIGMRFFRQATALLGTVLFMLFGGWGFTTFFGELGDKGLDIFTSLPQTYTRMPDVRADANWWNSNPVVLENPMVGHFFPQRPTLIGFPLVLLVLAWLYAAWSDSVDHGRDPRRAFLFCGVTIGLTPFFNLFAFGVPLAFVGLSWVAGKFRTSWLYVLVPAVVLALPVVVFLQPPSSTLEFPYDWVANIRNPNGVPPDLSLADRAGSWLVFWFRNLGFFLPLLAAAQLVRGVLPARMALGLAPVWLFFVVPNVIKPHPWNGNNTHYFVFVLLLGALPVAALLIELFKRLSLSMLAIVPVVVTMTLSGMLDVFATNGHYTAPYPVVAMDSAGVAVGEWARTTDPDSVFVIELGWEAGDASPHQHPLPALSGRTVLIGNDGWVFDLGIPDWFTRKDASRVILEAGEGHQQLIDTYDVDYLVIGPTERTPNWDPNIAFWEETADVVYRHAGWTVYEL